MNLIKYFEEEKVVRAKILETHNLEGKDLLPNLVLALQVELGELANETRCFKHWSVKGPSDKKVTLEEYADCLAFILEIGIELSIKNVRIYDLMKEKSVVDAFLSVFECISDLDIYPTIEAYDLLFSRFLMLGEMLGFKEKEIEEAYYAKHAINLQRQENGY